MTADSSIDVREVIFINPDAESAYAGLPPGAGEVADSIVTLLQNGQAPVRKGLWRTLKGRLRGIGEIRINDGTNTYRVYIWQGCGPALYIVDAGMKKSPTGNEIPQWQQERLVRRRDRAAQHCEDNRADLVLAFSERASQRERHKQGTTR